MIIEEELLGVLLLLLPQIQDGILCLQDACLFGMQSLAASRSRLPQEVCSAHYKMLQDAARAFCKELWPLAVGFEGSNLSPGAGSGFDVRG